MNSWWPWRKQRSLQTLFDGRVLWLGETPRNRILRLPPLDPSPDKPHPKNAPAGFYVLYTECITCGYPHVLAPELMDWDRDSEGRPDHCYFRKQPETALELIHAVKAVEGSCCGALRYHGSDPEIIERLKEAAL